jgi:cyclophilin family peptidyl-prolyl cis-trans isomerase/HEAT repeat protein
MKCPPALLLVWVVLTSGCGPTAPPVVTAAPPEPSADQKLRWILQLEDERIARGAERGQDLVAMLSDRQAHIRRRAAQAVGRARIVEAVPTLSTLVASEPDPEVRQMAAFALGLIGDASAADALTAALAAPEALVQGRAAEALGLLAHKPAASAIGAMIAPHLAAGVLSGMAADDVGYPKSPEVEAVRLGAYALVRLGAYDALASTFLDAAGQPRSRWWPVAFALQRVGDPRAAPVLLALLDGEGQLTRAFAARGLGVLKHRPAAAPLATLAVGAEEPTAVRVQAIRALAAIGDPLAAPALAKVVGTPKVDPNLQLEALTALGTLHHLPSVDLFIDMASMPWPPLRGAALQALAATDADTFIGVLSGLGPDADWSVRAALARALGTLPAERGEPRLADMLHDADQRVVAAVLTALAATRAPTAEGALQARLTADDPVVRMAAANGLAALKSTGSVGAITTALQTSASDSTYVARAALLGALATLDPAGARPAIVAELQDPDWAIRVRAAGLLKGQDPAADVSAMLPAPLPKVPELTNLEALLSPAFSPLAYIDTTKGMIQVELAVTDAPRTVANFIALARKGFFTGQAFHRVVPDFVAQAGDPRGDGEGGPGYTIRDEINQRPFVRGTVGMALDWADTGGSQFFITHSPQPHLDGRYTVFGQVVAGMDVVDRLSQWDVIRSLRVWNGVAWIGPGDN